MTGTSKSFATNIFDELSSNYNDINKIALVNINDYEKVWSFIQNGSCLAMFFLSTWGVGHHTTSAKNFYD